MRRRNFEHGNQPEGYHTWLRGTRSKAPGKSRHPGHLTAALPVVGSHGEAPPAPPGTGVLNPPARQAPGRELRPGLPAPALEQAGALQTGAPGPPAPLRPKAPAMPLRPGVPQTPRTSGASPEPPALMHPKTPPAPVHTGGVAYPLHSGASPHPQARFHPRSPSPTPAPPPQRWCGPPGRERVSAGGTTHRGGGGRAAPLGALSPRRAPWPRKGSVSFPRAAAYPERGRGRPQRGRAAGPLQPIRAASCLSAHQSGRFPGPGWRMQRRVRLSSPGRGRGGGASSHSAAADSSPRRGGPA